MVSPLPGYRKESAIVRACSRCSSLGRSYCCPRAFVLRRMEVSTTRSSCAFRLMTTKSLCLILFALAAGAFVLAGAFGRQLPRKWEHLERGGSARRAFNAQVIYTVFALIGGVALFRAAWHMRTDAESRS